MISHSVETPPFHLRLEDNDTSLSIDSTVRADQAIHFTSVFRGPGMDTPSTAELDAIHGTLPIPIDDAEMEAYILASPSTGIERSFTDLAPPQRALLQHLGFTHTSKTSADKGKWEHSSDFHALSLEATDQQAAAVFPSNGQKLVPSPLGFYTGRQYIEPLVEGERIIPVESMPWLLHDRIRHELAERALGETFVTLRKQIMQQVLHRGSAEDLRNIMLHDDTFTINTTLAILRTNGVAVIKRGLHLPFERTVQLYLASREFNGTQAHRELARTPRPDETYAPIVMDIARELQQRLTESVVRLEALDV